MSSRVPPSTVIGRRLLPALSGLYVLWLAVPGLSVLVGLDGLRPHVGAVGAGLVLAALAALVVARGDDPVEALGSLRVGAATAFPPLAYLSYMLATADPGTTRAVYLVAGLLAVVPGVAVPATAATLRNRRRREAATELVAVTVGGSDGDEDTRRAAFLGAALVGAVGVLAAGVAALVGSDGGVGVGTLTAVGSVSSWALLFDDGDGTTVTVTDRAVRFDGWSVPHGRFEGYRVTDSTVELVRSGRLGSTRRFDREAIDEAEETALLDGLTEVLPRLDDEGGAEASARRPRRSG